jgi:aminoglycoside phosphotransferase (APT) family kinase protein
MKGPNQLGMGWGCVMSRAVDFRERLARSLGEMQENGAAEICELLWETMRPSLDAEPTIRLETLKKEVYRLRLGSGQSLVLKRLKPAIAQTDRLVVERWLPALGFGDRCPRLLGSAALRDGRWVWHVHEDLGHETLAADRQPERLAAAVDLLAELHTRSAGHPLLPEVRWLARDQGAHFFTANLRDAITALETLTTTPPHEAPPAFAGARERLLHQLHHLREDAPRRVRSMEEAGPETLLHGDLWPQNVFVSTADGVPRARLIDWDHVGVGPFSYDLSTFLYRSAAEERLWLLDRYRAAAERAGRHLPGTEELNLLFHTAESARFAHSILFDAMAVLNDGAAWAIERLMDYARWFETLRPPLAE